MTTIAELLFDADDPDGRRQQVLDALRAPTIALPGSLPVPLGGLASAVLAVLDLPVLDVALRAWRVHADVAEARRLTAEAPGERRVVRLAGHSIRSRHDPRIEARYRGLTTPVLTLRLDLDIELAAVVLVVQHGEVFETAPHAGRVRARLSSSGVTLAKRTFRPLDATDWDAPEGAPTAPTPALR